MLPRWKRPNRTRRWSPLRFCVAFLTCSITNLTTLSATDSSRQGLCFAFVPSVSPVTREQTKHMRTLRICVLMCVFMGTKPCRPPTQISRACANGAGNRCDQARQQLDANSVCRGSDWMQTQFARVERSTSGAWAYGPRSASLWALSPVSTNADFPRLRLWRGKSVRSNAAATGCKLSLPATGCKLSLQDLVGLNQWPTRSSGLR